MRADRVRRDTRAIEDPVRTAPRRRERDIAWREGRLRACAAAVAVARAGLTGSRFPLVRCISSVVAHFIAAAMRGVDSDCFCKYIA